MDTAAARVTQVVPRLPPALSGVGDYASLLAGILREHHSIETRFIVGDPDWKGDSGVGLRVVSRSRRQLLDALPENGSVLLHYVGYGYAVRGCPFWLVRALETWRRTTSRRQLIIMFHELAASRGPFPSSSFFNTPLQRWLVARLSRMADVCHTNMARYAGVIESAAEPHRGKVVVHPVFSTVGEPATVSGLASRPCRVAIFGGGRWVREALSTHRESLLRCASAIGATGIVALGAPSGTAPRLPIPFEEVGVLSSEGVSQTLAQCQAGFFSYPASHLGKSSIFAAYCAHGLVPVSALPASENADGIRVGSEYFVADEMAESLPIHELQVVADAARGWYRHHSLQVSATAFAISLRRQALPA
jgi:hypothetical protein